MESNVRNEFYETPETMNKTAIGAHVATYFPTTSNIAAGVISGNVVFELNTGAGEYLDLFKTHLQLRYTLTVAGGGATSYMECPLANIFARGQLYINGKKVASSQNWTQDSILSKRITFSKAYNQSVNGLTYNNVALTLADQQNGFSKGVVAEGAGTYTNDEYLDALFMRDESNIIPPNCNVRLLLDVDSQYIQKMALLVTNQAPADPVFTVDSVRMIAYTIVKDGLPPSEHIMNLITLSSFLSSISGATENRQYQVNSTIVKAAVTFQSTAFATASGAKVNAGHLFNYATDDVGGATKLNTLDFKLNNIVVPNTRWDFSTHGYREAYLNYINESSGLFDDAGKETLAEYSRYGKIHLANIVKPESDKSNSLQVNASFAGTPLAFMIVTSFEEQVVSFKYHANGALLDTETLI